MPEVVSVAATEAFKPEGLTGTAPFIFTVTRTGDTSTEQTVDWAVAGAGPSPAVAADFAGSVLPSGTVTFAIGETTQTITVDVVADGTAEPQNGFLVTLSNPSAGLSIGAASAGGTIIDGDGSLALLSVDAVGNLVHAFAPALSPDGTKLFFRSGFQPLLPEDTNGTEDVYMKDLVTGVLTLVSTNAAGVQANDASFLSSALAPAAISADGTKIVFLSEASNLAPTDTESDPDVFVKDLTTGAITHVSLGPAGEQVPRYVSDWGPAISADGTKVVFAITPSRGSTDPGVYVKDLTTGSLTLVSTDGTGVAGNGTFDYPAFSPDGTKVAFRSSATNLVSGDTNSTYDVFIKDLATGTVTRLSTDGGGAEANSHSGRFGPVFSPDGTKVAFESAASNLVPGDTNGKQDIFVKDLVSGAISRVTTNAFGGQTNGHSYFASFSPDGTKLAFTSEAYNLVPGPDFSTLDVFAKDLVTGAITCLSTTAAGFPGNGFVGSRPVFTSDGTAVVFSTSASLLPDGSGIFRRELNFVATPSAPDLTDTSDDGVSDTDNITSVAAGIYAGTADPGSTVTLYDSDGVSAVGSAVADAVGNYSITALPMSGVHTLTARASLPSGASAASASLTVILGAVLPPPAHIVLDKLVDSVEVDAAVFTIADLGAGLTAVATFSDGVNEVSSGPLTANGNFTIDLSSLGDGLITSSVVVTDGIGVSNAPNYGRHAALNTSTSLSVWLNGWNVWGAAQTAENGAFSTIVIKDKRNVIEALTSVQLQGLAVEGITHVDSTNGYLLLTVSGYEAFLSAGIAFTPDDTVVLLDTGGNLQAVLGSDLQAHDVDRLDASDGALSLTVSQFLALGAVTLTQTDVVTLGDLGSSVEGMTVAGFTAVATRGVDVIDTTDDALSLTLNQILGLGEVVVAASDIFALSDFGGILDGAPVALIADLASRGIDILASTDGNQSLTLAGFNALGSIVVAAEDALTVTGTSGKDVFAFTTQTFDGNDSVDGGLGTDTLYLAHDHTVVFDAFALSGIEALRLKGGHDYELTMAEGNVDAGRRLHIYAGGLGIFDSIVFNGAAETDGAFRFLGGAGDNTFIGGNGTDTAIGGNGTNALSGGGGGDNIFAGGTDMIGYMAVTDSTGASYDTVDGFDTAVDHFDLWAGATVAAMDSAVTTGLLRAGGNFNPTLAAAVDGTALLAHHAVLFTPDAGTLAGATFLVVDVNGTAGYQAGQDLVVRLNNSTGTFTTTNFI